MSAASEMNEADRRSPRKKRSRPAESADEEESSNLLIERLNSKLASKREKIKELEKRIFLIGQHVYGRLEKHNSEVKALQNKVKEEKKRRKNLRERKDSKIKKLTAKVEEFEFSSSSASSSSQDDWQMERIEEELGKIQKESIEVLRTKDNEIKRLKEENFGLIGKLEELEKMREIQEKTTKTKDSEIGRKSKENLGLTKKLRQFEEELRKIREKSTNALKTKDSKIERLKVETLELNAKLQKLEKIQESAKMKDSEIGRLNEENLGLTNKLIIFEEIVKSNESDKESKIDELVEKLQEMEKEMVELDDARKEAERKADEHRQNFVQQIEISKKIAVNELSIILESGWRKDLERIQIQKMELITAGEEKDGLIKKLEEEKIKLDVLMEEKNDMIEEMQKLIEDLKNLRDETPCPAGEMMTDEEWKQLKSDAKSWQMLKLPIQVRKRGCRPAIDRLEPSLFDLEAWDLFHRLIRLTEMTRRKMVDEQRTNSAALGKLVQMIYSRNFRNENIHLTRIIREIMDEFEARNKQRHWPNERPFPIMTPINGPFSGQQSRQKLPANLPGPFYSTPRSANNQQSQAIPQLPLQTNFHPNNFVVRVVDSQPNQLKMISNGSTNQHLHLPLYQI